jgi:predicted outer membrane protein
MRQLVVTALALPLLALLGIGAALAMGPDPGGHTGATVTPETTKTGNAAVDAARQSTSGSKTETNSPAAGTSQPPPAKK